MLIVVVLTFAIYNLPFHARKIWQYWSRHYEGASDFNALFTPLTFLVSYFNSGVNPILYAFLSRNFRKGMRELLFCSMKKPWTNASIKTRLPAQVSDCGWLCMSFWFLCCLSMCICWNVGFVVTVVRVKC